ncbi:MAG: GNAT family N-acetyltransferase [Phycisphaerales bacterium]|nr:MAG: GNAT family N-acetyltransferase [Phycisphaerales bacterium]
MTGTIVGSEQPTLETERLVLRPLTPDDAPAVFRLYSDEAVTAFLGFDALKDEEQAAEIIREAIQRFEERRGMRWGIILRQTSDLIGTCSYKRWEWARASRAELGCDLLRAYWGTGLMTEALRETIRLGFEVTGVNRIEAMVFEGAERSVTLLNKLGFQLEGVLRDHGYLNGRLCDDMVFSLLKREWEEQTGDLA